MARTLLRTLKRRTQAGAAAVEFALIAMAFFPLLFAIIEFGRFMYVYNTVQEVTRRAARAAVVEDFRTGIDGIQRGAIFRAGTTGAVNLPASMEINSARVQINYLDAAMNRMTSTLMPADPADNIAACKDTTRVANCIRYVEVCVSRNADCSSSVNYSPMVGLFSFLAIPIPRSRVVMPAESLGATGSI